MKKIGLYIALLAVVCGLSGCLKDDNNYNYVEVNELVKGIRNLGDEYGIIEGDEYTFAPTFEFTIDKENPDVSYEWYVDKKLQEGETGPTFTFKGEKGGIYLLTFVVKDNKSGVRFSKSTKVLVRSIFQRGWVILSDESSQSVLNFIVPTTVHYTSTVDGEEIVRDSLVYHVVKRNVVPGLGTNPKGLMNNLGYIDYNYLYNMTVYDELVVKQDRWAELNGNTLQREIYTDEEFRGDIPTDFAPVEAAMTYSAKALLDKNGYIYFGKKGDVVDFHANTYVPVGLNNSAKFSRLFQSYKLNRNVKVILALTEDNSLVGILDQGEPASVGSTINEATSATSGEVYHVDDPSGENRFTHIDKQVVEALPSPYESGFDYSSAYPYWTVLLKDKTSSAYSLRYFSLDYSYGYLTYPEMDYFEGALGTITDYRGMANFGNRRFVVIADGDQLYYAQYGWDDYANAPFDCTLKKLGDAFGSPIKKVEGLDVRSTKQKKPYAAQLGVALEDGRFFIFGIDETKAEDGTTTAVSMKKQYPNEKTSEQDEKFGTIVDVLYKYGRGEEYMSFAF